MFFEVMIGIMLLAVINRLIYKWLMTFRDIYGR